MKKIKITGPDALKFAERLLEIAGAENLQVKTVVVLKYKRGAKLSYEQIKKLIGNGPFRVKIGSERG